MIIGCKDVDYAALRAACASVDKLVEYVSGLVPTSLRHIPAICDNQKYFIALHLRALQSIPWKRRKELCEGLLQGVKVKGVPDTFYDYSDILRAIDTEAFQRYMEEDKNAERRRGAD